MTNEISNETTTNNSIGINGVDVAESVNKTWIDEAIQREATPKDLRKETQQEFCKRIGIDTSTYYRNVMRPENKKKIVNIWLNEAFIGGNEVLKALQEKAKKGDVKAIELYMKFILELVENFDIKSGGNTFQVIFDNSFKNYANSASSSKTDS